MRAGGRGCGRCVGAVVLHHCHCNITNPPSPRRLVEEEGGQRKEEEGPTCHAAS